MARQISNQFLNELKTMPILEYVKTDDTLNMELRGNKVIIYYRGGKLLTVVDKNPTIFEPLDEKYLKENIDLDTENIEDYIPKAKRVIDRYVVEVKNHLWEKEIQQRVVQENNYSQNSLETDFFIIDTEYQDIFRFDMIALRWDSTITARKLQNYLPKITIFEAKQGFNDGSIKGTSGMYSHWNNFNEFIANKDKIESFKEDMKTVFEQKRALGLITGTEKYEKIDKIADDVDFVFLLANYKPASSILKSELDKISDCKFIFSNPMGYGLYERNIINKQDFIKRFLIVS